LKHIPVASSPPFPYCFWTHRRQGG